MALTSQPTTYVSRYSLSGSDRAQEDALLRLLEISTVSIFAYGLLLPSCLGELILYFSIKHTADKHVNQNFGSDEEINLRFFASKDRQAFIDASKQMQSGDVIGINLGDKTLYSICLANGKYYEVIADQQKDEGRLTQDQLKDRFLQALKSEIGADMNENAFIGANVGFSIAAIVTVFLAGVMSSPVTWMLCTAFIVSAGFTLGEFVGAYCFTSFPRLESKVTEVNQSESWASWLGLGSNTYQRVPTTDSDYDALVDCGL